MIISNKGKVLRYSIKGNYKVKEEIWKCSEEDKGTKIISAYSLNGDWIGDPQTAHRLNRIFGINSWEKIQPEHCVCSIGFSPRDNKWYGWSHRAIFGFGIGSSVNKGHCAYVPATPQELFDDVTHHWLKPENVEMTETGIRVREEMCKPVFNEEGIATEFIPAPDYIYEIECGKGEWTATTLEEAKQMAIDFANSVS